jgi:phosphotriesterase-related protein
MSFGEAHLSIEPEEEKMTPPTSTGRVITVLGEIDAQELGHTHTHEHLLSDLSAMLTTYGVRPVHGSPDVDSDLSRAGRDEFPASLRAQILEPIRLDNYSSIKHHVFNFDNLRLLSEKDAVEELHLYRAAGGGSMVESSPVGMGRDASGLARVSRLSGVSVIMGSGFYVREFHPPGVAGASLETIEERIVRDVTVGVEDTGVRAGIIGEIGLSSPMHPVEEKVLRAATRAQKRTGVALQVHPGREQSAPMQAMRIIEEEGGDPTRVVMCHIERTLPDTASMVELATTGCYLEFDLFGQESSYYAFSDIELPNDAGRINQLRALSEAGYLERLVVAQDICQKVYLRRYGGTGYAHILESVIPLMRRKGWSESDVRRLTHENPADLLSVH